MRRRVASKEITAGGMSFDEAIKVVLRCHVGEQLAGDPEVVDAMTALALARAGNEAMMAQTILFQPDERQDFTIMRSLETLNRVVRRARIKVNVGGGAYGAFLTEGALIDTGERRQNYLPIPPYSQFKSRVRAIHPALLCRSGKPAIETNRREVVQDLAEALMRSESTRLARVKAFGKR